jgi:hypothetical protein
MPLFFSLFPGRSSVGKSQLFESIALITGHQLVTTTSGASSEGGAGNTLFDEKRPLYLNDFVPIATVAAFGKKNH